MIRAPFGAPPFQTEEPATPQALTSGEGIDATPIRIERMLRSVFANELKIRQWEDFASSPGKRYAKRPGDLKPSWILNADLVGDNLDAARRQRDSHIAEVESVIDYALTTDAYEDVKCPDCEPWTMPSKALDFIRVAHEAEPPPGSTAMCGSCKGRGSKRRRKTDPESVTTFKRITYFQQTLATTVLCSKVRYQTTGSDEAYAELEQQNMRLLTKFGNESQTSMEGDDAEQGARLGIIDAAKRFDPTRKEGANFSTVAYNWAYRNSRARKRSDKRAGVYAPSIDGMGSDAEGNSVMDLIASSNGAVASFDETSRSDPALVIDMREQIASLPEMQRRIVLAIYGGDTVASAAKALGMKRSRVKQLRDEAFAALRGPLSGYVEVVCD